MLYHEVMLEDIAGGEETIMKAANTGGSSAELF